MTKTGITDFAIVLYRARYRSAGCMFSMCADLLGGFPAFGADGASTLTTAKVRTTVGDIEDWWRLDKHGENTRCNENPGWICFNTVPCGSTDSRWNISWALASSCIRMRLMRTDIQSFERTRWTLATDTSQQETIHWIGVAFDIWFSVHTCQQICPAGVVSSKCLTKSSPKLFFQMRNMFSKQH